jgi:tetratricopeptide (TPR) repeat protein
MPENRFLSTCVLVLLSLSSAALACGQAHGQKTIFLRGELLSDSQRFVQMSDYQVELVANGDHTPSTRAQVLPDGTFLLRGATPGTSQIRVLNLRGASVFEQYISVQEGVTVSVRLPEPGGQRAPGGTISARELANPTPLKAIREYIAAKKATAAGDAEKSIAHFLRAVEIHPGFMEAWNDLGVAYIKQRRFPAAVEAFRKAAAIDPDSPVVEKNLRVAEVWAGKLVNVASQPAKPF